jgi:hypothetical protein
MTLSEQRAEALDIISAFMEDVVRLDRVARDPGTGAKDRKDCLVRIATALRKADELRAWRAKTGKIIREFNVAWAKENPDGQMR